MRSIILIFIYASFSQFLCGQENRKVTFRCESIDKNSIFSLTNKSDSVLAVLVSPYYKPFDLNNLVSYGMYDSIYWFSYRFMNEDKYIDPATPVFRAMIILPKQSIDLLVDNPLIEKASYGVLIDYVFLGDFCYTEMQSIVKSKQWYDKYDWIEWRFLYSVKDELIITQ